MRNAIDQLEKLSGCFSRWLNWVAGFGLVAMLALVVIDVIGIKLFSQPVPGAIEIVGFLGIVITGFAIAYTQLLKRHIQVEFMVTHLPRKLQTIIGSLVYILGILLFAVLAWRSFDFGNTLRTTGEVSMTQGMPFYPFAYALAFCCIPVCLVLLTELLRLFVKSEAA